VKPASLLKMNPPLRTERDREALIRALRDGVLDAVATDHAPHCAESKGDDLLSAAPGMIGLETAFAVCVTLGGMGGDWLPTLINRLTTGPHGVLGDAAPGRAPRLRIGETASCVLVDPAGEWTVGEVPGHSMSRNTPLLGVRLSGRILLTINAGATTHHDERFLPWPAPIGEESRG
jgi:dihydroorotase